MSFQNSRLLTSQSSLTFNNWSTLSFFGGKRKILGEPLFTAAIRRFPISTVQCRKEPLLRIKIRAEEELVSANSIGTVLQEPDRSVKKVSAHNRRSMLSMKFQSSVKTNGRSEETKNPSLTTPTVVGLHTVPESDKKDSAFDHLPTHTQLNIIAPIPHLPTTVGHQFIDDELKSPYDIPLISPPFTTEAPCGWTREFSQQVREAMSELRGTALESKLKKWTDSIIKGQQLPSFETAGEYLSAIVHSVTLSPEGETFHQSRISRVFEDQINWLASFHLFKLLVDSREQPQRCSARL